MPVANALANATGLGRSLQFVTTNYSESITIEGLPVANSAGIIVTGAGQNVALFAFSARPTQGYISIVKIGGDQNITISGTVTTNGTVTFTASGNTQMTVLYTKS